MDKTGNQRIEKYEETSFPKKSQIRKRIVYSIKWKILMM